MKVCTDACLFGAWVGESVASGQWAVGSILDIGTGTGLLSMMLAQKSGALIDAIELDEDAAEQAAQNFEATRWKERLQVILADARTVHLGRKYDLIISNPPFFENDLKSIDPKRNFALHSEALSQEELLNVIRKYLVDGGRFAVLLAYHRKDEFTRLALAAGFFLAEEVSVKQTPNHPYFRAMLLFAAKTKAERKSTMIIREGDQYTPRFTELLKDYYLKL